MTKKKHEPVPDYEVEFIPIERRLSDRRSGSLEPSFPGDRRNRGRRADDHDLPATDSADKPAIPHHKPNKPEPGK
jgi:hypothetical protein